MDELTPDEADAWVELWFELGRRRMREIEEAIMRADVPESERAAALERFQQERERRSRRE